MLSERVLDTSVSILNSFDLPSILVFFFFYLFKFLFEEIAISVVPQYFFFFLNRIDGKSKELKSKELKIDTLVC